MKMVGVASGGTVGGGGTVEVDSYSNVAVGGGGATVEVEIVSRMSGAYSLYGPIGGTVGGGGTVPVGSPFTVAVLVAIRTSPADARSRPTIGAKPTL